MVSLVILLPEDVINLTFVALNRAVHMLLLRPVLVAAPCLAVPFGTSPATVARLAFAFVAKSFTVLKPLLLSSVRYFINSESAVSKDKKVSGLSNNTLPGAAKLYPAAVSVSGCNPKFFKKGVYREKSKVSVGADGIVAMFLILFIPADPGIRDLLPSHYNFIDCIVGIFNVYSYLKV